MQFFFQELYSHIDKNSGKEFEDMFLVKIVDLQGNLLNPEGTGVLFSTPTVRCLADNF